MSCSVKPKKPLSEDAISDKTTKSAELSKRNDSEPSTSYEVFRNNTTAVEVIVKEVNKNKKKLETEPNVSLQTTRRLKEEVETLQYKLETTNSMLSKSRKGYRMIIIELKKQLDALNRKELERQTENLGLQLENEKLKMLLELKTNLVVKFKKELNTMRRVLKFVMKNINFGPQFNENVIFTSDPEYEDFDKDLKKDIHVKFAPNFLEGMAMTFDSTISKDTKDSFDKHF